MKTYVVRFGWLVLSLLFIVATLEAFARILGFPQPYSALFEYNNTLGFSTPKSAKVIFNVRENIYTIGFNEDGYADYSYEQHPNLVILGDGLIAGLELPQNQRLAAQLSRLTGLGVANLAVTGYGTCQQYLQLEEYLNTKALPMYVVLVANIPSDILDSQAQVAMSSNKIVFVQEHEQWKLISPPEVTLLYKSLSYVWKKSRLIGAANYMLSTRKINEAYNMSEKVINKRDVNSWAYCKNQINNLASGNNILLVSLIWSETGRSLVESLAKDAIMDESRADDTIYVDQDFHCANLKKCFVVNTKHLNAETTQMIAGLISKSLRKEGF
ncbi:hypothetical protein [uncultured Thiobacillus sp.]|uniref:hypothetical protein n=1 Tax=uncultured Thiobacillus sp. TaxID=189996 RepID=UPI00260FABCA|nr:hypothetical protein [uncultured Thiobacillus sp.]